MMVTQNRDLSWLKFNKRVLNESTRDLHPLLERALFLKIATNNLKEFAMIRVSSLKSLLEVQPEMHDAYSNHPLKEVIKKINKEIKLQREAILMSGKQLLKGFKSEGIALSTLDQLSDDERQNVIRFFKEKYMSLAFELRVPLSEFVLSVKSNTLYRMFKNKKNHYFQLGFVEALPYAIKIDSERYIRTDHLLDVIYQEKGSLYFTANFIRDADLNFDAFDDDELPKKMTTLLKQRDILSLNRLHLKSSHVNEILNDFNDLHKLLGKEILTSSDFESWELLYAFLNQEIEKNHPRLRYPLYQPVVPSQLKPKKSLIKQIQDHDQLWHYPYDSFATFEKLILEAATHKDVKAIYMTMYRLAQNSKIIDYLKLARKNAKKVVVILELRARFDEANNLYFAEDLKAAGCEVYFGPKKIKIHAKMMVMTLKNHEYITQIGSGNYHEITALKYTDFAYLTSRKSLGEDALSFFEAVSQKKETPKTKHLLVGPGPLKKQLLDLIDQEIKKKEKGYIGFKINALTDQDMIEKLIEASQKGVKITAIIRSIHCLLPGVKGATENIQMFSIVGRYLEHSRVYIFGYDDPTVLIGSSDMMSRNLQRRHEILCPVLDDAIKKRLLFIFKMTLKDNLFTAKINDQGQHIMKNDSLPFSIQDAWMNPLKYL
jgi:polyphosphate kinase